MQNMTNAGTTSNAGTTNPYTQETIDVYNNQPAYLQAINSLEGGNSGNIGDGMILSQNNPAMNPSPYGVDQSYMNYIIVPNQAPAATPATTTTPAASSPVNMVQATPQSVLQQYYDTPGFINTYGMTAYNNAMNGNFNPVQNFQASPGYQFQQQQGLQQVQQNMAAQGLLNSGADITQMQNYASNLANQTYNTYQTGMTNAFNNYQSQLQSLANGGTSGASVNGANQATAAGNNTASIIQSMQQALSTGGLGLTSAQMSAISSALSAAMNATGQVGGAATEAAGQEAAAQSNGLGSIIGSLASTLL